MTGRIGNRSAAPHLPNPPHPPCPFDSNLLDSQIAHLRCAPIAVHSLPFKSTFSTQSQTMRIHLATYATPIFLHRQWFLGKSALANRVVDSVTNWTPSRLLAAGFNSRAPKISLRSRGSGFWAWKPFIIEHHLARIPDGDFVLYCDVGRRNDFKQLTWPLDGLMGWMNTRNQDILPGLLIPWKGPMSMWTKRDAFLLTGMDSPEAHSATPIQTSFSLWKAGRAAREVASAWMDLCAEPNLVGDVRGVCGLPELPDFKDHRHDQSLLTLCCLRKGVEGLDLGAIMPPIDTQHPSEVTAWLSGNAQPTLGRAGRTMRFAARPLEAIEKGIRRIVRIG